MKLRLRSFGTLVLVAAAASYLLAMFSEMFGPMIHYKWVRESTNLRGAHIDISLMDHDTRSQIPIGDSLLSSLPASVLTQLPPPSGRPDHVDIWGNPYHIVHEQRDGAPFPFVGIYSCGQDGVSHTTGNDPDDLNTWGQDGTSHYRPIIRGEHARRRFWLTAMIFAAIAPLCYLVLRRSSRRLP